MDGKEVEWNRSMVVKRMIEAEVRCVVCWKCWVSWWQFVSGANMGRIGVMDCSSRQGWLGKT